MPDTCLPAAGGFVPVVNRNRCEAKGECVRVCPYKVFDIQPLSGEQRAALSLRGRLKAWAHGGRQARVAAPGACHRCQACVRKCPERALVLRPAG